MCWAGSSYMALLSSSFFSDVCCFVVLLSIQPPGRVLVRLKELYQYHFPAMPVQMCIHSCDVEWNTKMKIKFESNSLQEAVESVPGCIALLCPRIVHDCFSFCIRTVYMASQICGVWVHGQNGLSSRRRAHKRENWTVFCDNDDDSRDEIFCDQRIHLFCTFTHTLCANFPQDCWYLVQV